MAVIEIAKIKVRRGQEGVTGIPTLDSGEFGWAIDTQNLYIGNGSLAEGAPAVGNTRILTQNDINLFDLATSSTVYSYLNPDNITHRAPGINVYTDPSGAAYTYRNMADKLNDFATIYDFGGINDGDTDNTTALQNAINQLWLNDDRNSVIPRGRVALRIPAGVYLVSGTIYLPPYATLIGEGQEKTIIQLSSPYQSLLQTEYIDGFGVPFTFIEGDTVIGDSIRNINLIGITFEYASSISVISTLPLLRMDSAIDSQIIDCRFNGQYPAGTGTLGSPLPSPPEYSGIEIRSQGQGTGGYQTKNLLIKNCTFDGLVYGIYSKFDVEDTVIDSCIFRNSNRGIVGSPSGAATQVGPTRTKIQNCNFDQIENEAIYFYDNEAGFPANNISLHNTFLNVGNNLAGNKDISSNTAVMYFQSRGNRSIEDQIDRYQIMDSASTTTYYHEVIEGYGYVEHTDVIERTLQTDTHRIAKFAIARSNQAIRVQYSIVKPTTPIFRTGELIIQVAVDGPVPTAAVTDSYSLNGTDSGSIEFNTFVDAATNTVLLYYINSGGIGIGDVIRYKYNQLQ